jgi:hypothetical protein
MMHLNRDSVIHSSSKRFCIVYKSKKSDPLKPSRQHDIPSRRPTVQSIIRPDDENFMSRPSSVSRNFELFQLASVWTFQHHVQMTHSVFDQLWDVFPKHRYGKITATVRTMWIPVRTRSSIRQVAHSKCKRLDHSFHGPDARATYMEIACI